MKVNLIYQFEVYGVNCKVAHYETTLSYSDV